MNKQTAHIISHTHWDREWYINSRYVNEWLPPFFEGLFERMDQNDSYRFVLDGQTSMLDDCYVELEKLGRNVEDFKARVKGYATKGQLVIGPYYLQPDWQLVSGESLIRNMLIGKTMSEELGGGTKTGWILDSFGQISQAPQLHKQFDMKGIVVWRGVELDPFNLNSEFEWVGADGTKMTCGYLLSSYRNAMHLADYPEIIYERITNEVEKIAPFATTGNVLLMNGYDQEMQPDDILPFIEDGKADFKNFVIKQSSPDEYMQALVDGRGELQQLHGALYSGRYISVFPGILSARMYLKTSNYYAQRQLESYAEPLSAMATALTGCDYPHSKMDTAWKVLLKNHPHDSICAVSVDDVHYDMEDRFAVTIGLSEEMTKSAVSTLSTASDTSMFADSVAVYTIFNTMAVERSQSVFLPFNADYNIVVKNSNGDVCESQRCDTGVVVIVKIAAMASESIGLYRDGVVNIDNSSEMMAENEYISVVCNTDGTFNITDKVTGKKYTSVGALENMADSGDEYNYSFIPNDIPLTTLGVDANVTVSHGAVQSTFTIERVWALPKSIADNRAGRSTETNEIPITTTVTLTKGDPVLRFETSLRNTCRDHRIRVLFPTEITADCSYAQTQFDVTSHPIIPKEFDNDSIPENVKRIIIGARECIPITQFPQRDFCAVTDGNITAAVLNVGLPEYEILPSKNTVALTLFRSLGWLARFDLHTRIGDAGPEMLTPGAQCLRDMTFNYGFCSLNTAPTDHELDNIAVGYVTPMLAVKNSVHGGALDISKSFASLSGGKLHLSALKCAENSDDVVIRVYNPNDTEVVEKIAVPFAVKVSTATPYEAEKEELTINNEEVTLTVKPREIVTVRVETKTISKTAINSDKEIDFSILSYPTAIINFSNYTIPDCVTIEEVKSEEARADSAEAEYAQKLAKAQEAEKELAAKENPSAAEKTNAATLMMYAYAIQRASLEARLSAIFARETMMREKYGADSKEFIEHQESLTPRLRELAYGLNLARIDKRVSEYITDYYVHKEKNDN